MIYCVEDDKAIRNLMIYTLNAAGFEAAGFSDGEAEPLRLCESDLARGGKHDPARA